MKKNQVVLIHGMPATGKYTMARLIQKEEGGVLLDNHYFHDMFVHKIEVSDVTRDLYFGQIGRLKKQYIDILRQFYPKSYFVRYIFTSVMLKDEDLLERLEAFARDIKADFIPIELTGSKEVLQYRCQTEYRRKRKKISNPENLERFLNKYKELMPKYAHPNKLKIDVSQLDEKKTFDFIRKHLQKFE